MRHATPVGLTTGPMNCLADRDLLVVADVENLSISAEDIGFVLHYRALANRISSVCKTARFMAFATIEERHRLFAVQLRKSGWELHARPVEHLSGRNTNDRRVPVRNSDSMMLMITGHLLTIHRPDVLVIGSGDGALVVEMARTARSLRPGIQKICTLSVPTSTSAAAISSECVYIDDNIFLGTDALSRTIAQPI